MNKLNENQALEALYNAARLAPLSANDHDQLSICAKTIHEFIKMNSRKNETEGSLKDEKASEEKSKS